MTIPKFAEAPKMKSDISSLLEELSGELKFPTSSIPDLTQVFIDILSTIEDRYAQLVDAINLKQQNEKDDLRRIIVQLKGNQFDSFYKNLN